MVADVLVLSPLLEPAGLPKYISFFFLTLGVAKVVDLATFWHLAQTMALVFRVLLVMNCHQDILSAISTRSSLLRDDLVLEDSKLSLRVIFVYGNGSSRVCKKFACGLEADSPGWIWYD